MTNAPKPAGMVTLGQLAASGTMKKVCIQTWHLEFENEKRISVTLSSKVLARVDQLAGSKRSRSAVIERAVRSYLRQHFSAAVGIDDLELINRAAYQLNVEAIDALEYASAFVHDQKP